MTDELRAKFEAWYVENAFDYPSNPIGSRECGLQWKAWQAAHASRDAEVEALRKDAERYRAFRRAAIREDDSFIERVMLRIPDKDCTESQFDEAIDAAMQEESK